MARYIDVDKEIDKLQRHRLQCLQRAELYKQSRHVSNYIRYRYRKLVATAANAQMRINWLNSMDVIEFNNGEG